MGKGKCNLLVKLKSFISEVKPLNMFMLTVAGIVNGFGIKIFLSPVNLYDSGISGTSMLLEKVTPEYLTLSLFLIVLNIPLFIYGLKKQGAHFTFYAIYTVMIYSVVATLIDYLLPVEEGAGSLFAGNDLVLCALFGGIISGIGSGLALRFGGAMDGIEVMAVIFAKRLGVTVGTFVMGYNIVLYIVCGVVTGSWILPLYSIVTYGASLKTVDFIVEGFDRSKVAMIITVKPDEICKALSDTFETGMTRIEAKGGYSNENKTLIYFVVNRFQVTKMKNIVHDLDHKAYITISDVADVFKNNNDN